MDPKQIVVQPCGCVALPEELSEALGMLPGATLSLSADVQQRTVTLRLVTAAPITADRAAAACPISA